MGDHPMLWGCVLVAALAILASAGRARAAGAAKPDAVAGPSLVSFESAGPLTEVYVSSDLECDVNHELDAHGEFFGETACGTFVAYGGVLYAPNGIPAGGGTVTSTTSFYEPVSQSAVSGDGSRGNPLRITSRVHAGPGLDVVQTDTYVVGEETLRTDVVLQNATATPLSVRVYRAGDCYLNDSDYGPGRIFAESGSIACASAVSDRVERWVPHTAGSHFYEGFYDDTWRLIGAQAPFPDTCRCDENIDNSAGLQWDVAVPANGTTSISSSITFSPTGGQGGLVAGDVQVEGIPAVGQQLTCATYGWLNARSFAFEWIANASSLPGATSQTYVPTADQQGALVQCRIAGTGSDGSVERRLSPPVSIGYAQARPSIYVALGDSYSSGEGAVRRNEPMEERFYAGTDVDGNRCHRSPDAYPAVLARRINSEGGSITFDPTRHFRACSGAVFDDLYLPNGENRNELPQLAALDGIGADVRLVTFSMGGNDAHFSLVVQACLFGALVPKLDAPCALLGPVVAFAIADLVHKTAGAIFDVRTRATRAKIVVVGYPDSVPLLRCVRTGPMGLSEFVFLKGYLAGINAAIRAGVETARALGAGDVVFADTTSQAMRDHHICAREGWVWGVFAYDGWRLGLPPQPKNAVYSFHPNEPGQSDMAATVLGVIGGPAALLRPSRTRRPAAASASVLPGGVERLTQDVAAGSGVLSVAVSLKAGVGVRLLDPAGQASATPRQYGDQLVWTVTSPAAGTWTVELTGGPDLPPAGVTVPMLAAVQPPLVLPPVAAGSVAQRGRSLTADATRSFVVGSQITSVTWDWGDGSTSSEVIAKHRYTKAGTYAVNLTVNDDHGQVATTQVARVVVGKASAPGSVDVSAIGRRSARVRGTLRCRKKAIDRCTGVVVLTARIGKRQIVIGGSPVEAPAGASSRFSIPLDAAARRALRKGTLVGVVATATVRDGRIGKPTTTRRTLEVEP